MLNQINNIKSTVKNILTSDPDTRDNDRLLILKIWATQEPKLRDPNFSFKAFGASFREGDYIDPESIRRTRQKLQEEFEYLRGRNYQGRQKHSGEVKKSFSKYY